MKFVHAMIRVSDLQASLHFYQALMGLKLLRRMNSEKGRFSLYYLASEEGAPEIELTHNWDEQPYTNGNAFGHLAFRVDDIHAACGQLAATASAVKPLPQPRSA